MIKAVLSSRPALCITGIVLIALLPVIIFYPGISGPYIFDDAPNILNNSFIKIKEISFQSLYHAGFSLKSGPLMRPVSMISFALNYYFSGGFANPVPFKLTNIIIHIANGLLIFWLVRIVLQRVAALHNEPLYKPLGSNMHIILAASCALMWVAHPIQLTSVLYIVQRMAELSAFFMLLGIIFYMKGRLQLLTGRRSGFWLMLLGLLGFGTLGIFSKENAALLPIFMVLLEYLLFANERPWPSWRRLPVTTRRGIYIVLLVALLGACIWAFQYAAAGYNSRSFTLYERVITEPRVLLFYISLILLPRLSQFGLYHDDIAISTSLLTPWTTLPAILILAGSIVLAFYVRKRHVLISMGILWFLIGHALESTIFSLEIAHEHRNYLSSLGILIIVMHSVIWGYRKLNNRGVLFVIPVLILLFGMNTFIRSMQWKDIYMLLSTEAAYHPGSARALADYGAILFTTKQYKKSIKQIRGAIARDPDEPGYYINLHIISAVSNIKLSDKEHKATLALLKKYPRTNLLQQALYRIHVCIMSTCRNLAPKATLWLTVLLENRTLDTASKSYYNYMLGRVLRSQGKHMEAMDKLRLSYKLDPQYMHPMFEHAYIYLDLKDARGANNILSKIERVNKNHTHPRNDEVNYLKKAIHNIKTR